MALLIFAALTAATVLALAWGTTGAALLETRQVAMERAAQGSGWPITPAHLRMW